MRKLIFLLITLVTVSTNVFADSKMSFAASAPDVVVVGDQFRLTYTVTTQKVRDFRAPSIKGFDVLMGPTRSTFSNTQIINGAMSSESGITFTYILMATTEEIIRFRCYDYSRWRSDGFQFGKNKSASA